MAKIGETKKLIRELAELLVETGLSEIEVEDDDFRVRVVAQNGQPTTVVASAPAVAAPSAEPATSTAPPAEAAASADLDPGSHPGAVLSPMVGTAYMAPDPASEPFVKVGDEVKEGDTLLIIEAMKVMNPIPAPKAGRVAQILFEDAQPIEFEQPLVIIE